MDQQQVQRTRYQLQTRFRRVRNAPWGNFELVALQVLDWLERHPILAGIVKHLDNLPGDHHAEVECMITSGVVASRYFVLLRKRDHKQESEPEFKGYTPRTLEEHASACLEILRATIRKPDRGFYEVLATYLTQEEYSPRTDKDPLDAIKEIAVRDLYEYLDEQLDAVNAVNGLLGKYKQGVEWFQQGQIRKIVQEGYDGAKGERALARHLQQYVFDQGVDFTVEPTSASGAVDILLRDPNGQYVIIDAKYLKPGAPSSEITRKIAGGFNQVARYCEDYDQHDGFLAVFVDDDLSLLIDSAESDSFRYFRIGGSIIYFIEVNVAKRPSASKSGKARQIHITEADLMHEIEVYN